MHDLCAAVSHVVPPELKPALAAVLEGRREE
jgi:hypothetical protein